MGKNFHQRKFIFTNANNNGCYMQFINEITPKNI